ncbi:MAG TPA: hypothetical protein VH640_32000, partial [Bryobacteraceae bacterium]
QSRAGTFCIKCAAFSAPDFSLISQGIAAAEALAYSIVWGTTPQLNGYDPLAYLQLLLGRTGVVTSTIHY